MKRQTHTAPAIAWRCIVVVSSPEQSFQDGSMMTYPTLALFDNQQGIVILKEPVELCSWQQAQWVFPNFDATVAAGLSFKAKWTVSSTMWAVAVGGLEEAAPNVACFVWESKSRPWRPGPLYYYCEDTIIATSWTRRNATPMTKNSRIIFQDVMESVFINVSNRSCWGWEEEGWKNAFYFVCSEMRESMKAGTHNYYYNNCQTIIATTRTRQNTEATCYPSECLSLKV